MRLKTAIFVLLGAALSFAQQSKLLHDEEARALAVERGKQTPFDHGCVDPTRKESLESALFQVLPHKIVADELNHPVFFYELSDAMCYSVAPKADGSKGLQITVSTHGGTFGYSAVDRRNGSTYLFDYSTDSRKELVKLLSTLDVHVTSDEQAYWIADLYRQLLGRRLEPAVDVAGELQFKHKAEDNFRSAWSPYDRDQRWEAKFRNWWARFRKVGMKADYEVKSEKAPEGFLVHGLAFRGYSLTIPRTDPPPKGKPALIRWNLLVKPDTTVAEREPQILFE